MIYGDSPDFVVGNEKSKAHDNFEHWSLEIKNLLWAKICFGLIYLIWCLFSSLNDFKFIDYESNYLFFYQITMHSNLTGIPNKKYKESYPVFKA